MVDTLCLVSDEEGHNIFEILKSCFKTYVEISVAYMVEKSPLFAGPVFSCFSKPQDHVREAWESDKKGVLNYPLSNDWSENTIQEESAKELANYFKVFSMSYALAISRKINLKQQFGVNSVLDVAGGSGVFR